MTYTKRLGLFFSEDDDAGYFEGVLPVSERFTLSSWTYYNSIPMENRFCNFVFKTSLSSKQKTLSKIVFATKTQ